MSKSGDASGCGCLIIFVVLCLITGSWEGLALLVGGWLFYLVFIGVSIGVIAAIAQAISGK